MVDQKAANDYVNHVLKTLENDPKSLDKHEKRLGSKYRECMTRMQKISKDISDMRNQIEQAQTRLKSMELSLEQEQGRSNGFIEYLVDLKFLEEPGKKGPAEGDAQDGMKVEPANRHERRAAAAAAKSKKPTVKTQDGKEASAA